MTQVLGVDPKLQELNFGHHLGAIHDGLRSDNPEAGRSAVYACRSLLHDLSKYLWQDSRPTYDHLLGQGKGGKPGGTTSDGQGLTSPSDGAFLPKGLGLPGFTASPTSGLVATEVGCADSLTARWQKYEKPILMSHALPSPAEVGRSLVCSHNPR